MEVVTGNTLLPGDPRLIDHIVCELKSQGIFDQFRKECIADVDTKPAYQNLRQRVEGSVTGFLKNQVWKSDMNKNQLREMLRKNIYESGFLETGVERIVDQVVNPKINTVFLPQVEDVVYKFLGLQKPVRNYKNGPLSINTVDLLPTDLDPISPDSEVLDKTINKSNETEKHDDSKADDFESPPFEPINEQSVFSQQDESSNDSHLSGISGLTSHDSNLSNSGSPNKTYYNVPEISNQDSQLSKVSSNSRLSIITTEDKLSSEKMDISDDTQASKVGDSNSNSFKFGTNSNSENGFVSNFNIKEQIDVIMTEQLEGMEVGELEKKEILDKDTTEIAMDVSDSQDKTEIETSELEKVASIVEEKTEAKLEEKIEEKLEEKPSELKPELKTEDKTDSKSSKSRSDSEKRKSKSEPRKSDKKSDEKDKKSDRKDKSRSSSSSKDRRDKSRDKRDSKTDSKDSKSDSKSESKSESKSDSKSDPKVDSKSDSKDSKSDKDRRSSSKHSSRDKERSSSKSDRKDSSSRDKDRSESRSKSSKDSKSRDESKNREEKKSDDSKTRDDSKKDDKRKSNGDSKSRSRTESSSKSKDYSKDSSKESSKEGSKDSKDSSKDSRDSKDKDKDRKSSSSSHRKDSKKPRRDKDDHFSSKDKKSDNRRSADRDSNDGSSGVGSSNNKESNSSSSKSKSSEGSFSGSNSGDSGSNSQSDNLESADKYSDGSKTVKYVTQNCLDSELNIASPKINDSELALKFSDGFDGQGKLKKPKIASNIFEARKLMKIRKKMEKMEKKRQKEIDLAQKENHFEEREESVVEDEKKEEGMVTIVEIKADDFDEYDSDVSVGKTDDELQVTRPVKTYSYSKNSLKKNDVIENNEEILSLKPLPVVSKESWDAIEAKMMSNVANIDYNSYVDENADSCESTKSVEQVEVVQRKSTDEEDCLYFNPEVSPTTERYLKRIDDLQKSTANMENIFEGRFSMGPPGSPKSGRRPRKPNSKYSSNEYDTEEIEQENYEGENSKNEINKKKRGIKRRTDGDFEGMENDNNNKKIHVLEDIADHEVSEYGNTSNSLESSTRHKVTIKAKKSKKTELSNHNDSFSLPLSPESDISSNSVEIRNNLRKASEERDALVQQLTQPIRNTRGHSTANQRYSSDDLYKPRPLFTGSRRTRGIINNSDKGADETTSKRR